MGKIEFIQGEINQNRFLMGLFSAIIISLFSYLVANFEKGNIYLLSSSGVAVFVLTMVIGYLQIKIKRQIKSLEDIEK